MGSLRSLKSYLFELAQSSDHLNILELSTENI